MMNSSDLQQVFDWKISKQESMGRLASHSSNYILSQLHRQDKSKQTIKSYLFESSLLSLIATETGNSDMEVKEV